MMIVASEPPSVSVAAVSSTAPRVGVGDLQEAGAPDDPDVGGDRHRTDALRAPRDRGVDCFRGRGRRVDGLAGHVDHEVAVEIEHGNAAAALGASREPVLAERRDIGVLPRRGRGRLDFGPSRGLPPGHRARVEPDRAGDGDPHRARARRPARRAHRAVDALGAGQDRLGFDLGDERLQFGRRRLVERALAFGPHEGERVADGADDLRVLGDDDVELHRPRDRAAEATRPAADRDDDGPFEMMVADDARDEVADRLSGRREHAPGHLFGRGAARSRPPPRTRRAPRPDRRARSRPASTRPSAFAAHVLVSATRAAVGEPHDQVVGRVAGRGARSSVVAPGEVGGGQEAGVRQPRDVRAARADAVHAIAANAQHRAARDTEHAHVEGADRSRVAGDLHVRERGPPAADRRDVGGRAADLDDHRVLDATRSQRAGDRRRGSGVERARRGAPEPGEVGGATVTAHDHHRAADARRGDAGPDHLGGAQARSGGSTRSAPR